MVSFQTFFNLILEDLQSSINQSIKILTSNGYSPEEASQAVDTIRTIMREVGDRVNAQQKRFNVDANIPILSYLLISLKDVDRDPYVKIKREYETYLSSPEATAKKILTTAFDKLRNEIQAKKLFKPSTEKTQFIVSWGTKLIEEIHKYIKSDETDTPVVKSDEDVVYENDDIVIYRADSKNKCIAYGAGSNLCISTKGGGNFYWAYRMGEMRRSIDGLGMTTYFVFWKDTNERILIDALGNEDGPANKYSWNNIEKDGKYDNEDEDITPKELIKMHPELKDPFSKNVFQFIPYGEDERRFIYIQKNISEIWDSRLKTFKDYEMFLEGQDPDDYYNSTFIRFDTWSHLIESGRMSEAEAKILVKKYAGLNFNLDIETQKELLSPSDRNWYLNTVLPKREEESDILGYIKSVRGKEIPDTLYERLSIGDEIYEVLANVFNIDEYYVHSVFSLRDAYNIIVGNIDEEILLKLKGFVEKINNPGALFKSLMSHYQNNNKKIPKLMYKLIIQYPSASFNAAMYWHNMKKGEIPNVLIKSAIKDPKYALMTAAAFFEKNDYGRREIPNYIKSAVFKDPQRAYEFIKAAIDGLGFENYPVSEIAKLFSKEDLGLRYVIENEGFGIYKKEYDKSNTQNYSKVRKAIYANILKNGKKIHDDIYLKAYAESSVLYKMLKKSLDRYEAKLNKDT